MNEIVAFNESSLSLSTYEDLVEESKEFAYGSKAANTLRGYNTDWRHFKMWCNIYGRNPMPADSETVRLFITSLAKLGRKVGTIQRKINSISVAHQTAGFAEQNPTRSNEVKTVMVGIRRKLGTAQEGKAPAVTDVIRAMMDTLGDRLIDHRDRALILIGFTGAFRRSELVGLDREDVEFTREGLVITLRRSKTDQEGEGRKIGISYGSNLETCPVRSLLYYIEETGIESGPLFRSINRHGHLRGRLTGQSVAMIVKKRVKMAGLDPKKYGGHSLRSGFATSAAEAGVSERKIMDQTGHKSIKMVRRYIREGSLFKDNATAKLGL